MLVSRLTQRLPEILQQQIFKKILVLFYLLTLK